MSAHFEEFVQEKLISIAEDVSALKAQHAEHVLSHQRDTDRARYHRQLRVSSALSLVAVVVAIATAALAR